MIINCSVCNNAIGNKNYTKDEEKFICKDCLKVNSELLSETVKLGIKCPNCNQVRYQTQFITGCKLCKICRKNLGIE